MEVHLPAGCRMSRRVAGGDDSVQNAAGAVGQGADSNREKDSAARVAQRCPFAYEGRGLVPPNGKYQLSVDDHAFGAAAPGDDHSVLPGLVSDALHRLALVYGVDVFDFEFLSGIAARTVSSQLAARVVVPAVSDGARNRTDHHEYQSGPGSARGQGKRFRANPEVQCGFKAGQSRRQQIPQKVGMGPLAGTIDWRILRGHGVLRR